MRRLNLSYWVVLGLLLPVGAAVAALVLGENAAFLVCIALIGVSSAIVSLRE